MMPESEVIFKVSEEALEMVKKGEAVFSSGGIRKKTGELIELAKPSILEKVEQQYVEIKPLIDNSKAVSLINSMKNVQALSWANAAIGLVNCGLTFICYKKLSVNIKDLNTSMIQSFYDLKKNINQVIEILHDVDSHITRLENERLIEQFRGFFANLEYDVSKLNSGSYDLKDNSLSRDITNLLNKVMSFLYKILDKYENDELEDEFVITTHQQKKNMKNQ